jgi:hypothetical protein
MGNSMPPPAAFDLVDSFVRRRGTEIELVLANAKLEESVSTPDVILAQGSKTVTATGVLTTSGKERHLVARAPRASLVDGVWTIAVQTSAEDKQMMQARILVQGQRPLVLLWGAKHGETTQPKRVTPKQRLAATGGKALDVGLSLLPPSRAQSIRVAARNRARKLLH